MLEEIRLTPQANPGGEFSFVSPGLYLSFHLGNFLALEQRATDGLWRGASLRGDVKVVLPGEERAFMHRRPARFARMSIPRNFLDRLDITPDQLRPHVILRDPPLRLMLDSMLAESAYGPPSSLFISGAVQAIVGRLAALNGHAQTTLKGRLSPHRLERALALINDRLEENLSILELARACDLSPSHFAALFKASVGESPHRHQIRRRVERAEAMMRNGMTGAAAATAAGFCDQSHLARHQRRLRSTRR